VKIGLVTHNVLRGDGQGRVNYELTLALRRAGHDVELIAAHVAPEVLDAGVTWEPVIHRVNAVDLVRGWDFSRRVDALWPKLAPRYDATLACGFVTRRPHTVNAVHFVHGTWLRSPYHTSRVRRDIRGAYHRLYSMSNARWERQTFSRAGAVVAVSDMVRRELLEIGVPEEKLNVIVNGVDPVEFAPGPSDRRALGLPEGVPLGLFVGDLRSPIKNLDVVLRALTRAPDVHLAVAGALRGSAYPAMTAALDLTERVHFLDFRRDIPDLMRAADFFALPSRRDSCPLVLLEALASGLPAIVTDRVGTSDLVGDRAGFVVTDPDDDLAVARALTVLSTDAAQHEAMSLEARAVALRHSWAEMAGAYAKLIESEVARAGRRAAA
jgi:glycosyltransferase involved in cell wall biosynthesis